MYLYKVYDINRNVVLRFKYEYLSCFEVMEILRENINYIMCTREKITDKQLGFLEG